MCGERNTLGDTSNIIDDRKPWKRSGTSRITIITSATLVEDEITLLDIVLAVEGSSPAFRCNEIRQRGPNPLPVKPTQPCVIASAMLRAERAYRAELKRTTIADILAELAQHDTDGAIAARGCAFIDLHVRRST